MAEAWKKWEGQVVNGEFKLRQYLGGSDRSAVFLTDRGERDPQRLAIKLIRANGENPELQLSWWELAAKLSHPNLLRLYQRGRCQVEGMDLFYAAMEFADESLAQIIPYRPLTAAEARETLPPMLEALGYIHTKGFVHGHVKPANIVAVGDQVKLSSDELCGAGESGRVLGTPSAYAAPEIVRGGGMSPASDVWSVGMTLVEAMTQRLPVLAGPEQTEVVLPETLPEPFLDIARHCLQGDPQRRWTIAQILAKLQQSPAVSVETPIPVPSKASAKWGFIAGAVVAAVFLWAILIPHVLNRAPQKASSVVPESAAPTQPSAPSPAAKVGAARKLSTGTASRVPGQVMQQVMPDVSPSALRTIHGDLKVRIRNTVDASGNVTAAKFETRGPSRYFADRALRAAQRWTFKPPQVDGKGVASQWDLRFEFRRSGTTVHPSQTSP